MTEILAASTPAASYHRALLISGRVSGSHNHPNEWPLLIAACERELRESDSAEATDQLEARIAATLANTGKQVQSLFTLVHAQFALTNSLLQYVLTCVVEPPEEVLPAARARAKARYAKILRLAGEEVATRNQATLEQVLTHSK